MYAHLVRRNNERVLFEAALHGVDLNKNEDGEVTETKKTNLPVATDEGRNPWTFGDPATDYNHLSDEEKELKTKQMMSMYRIKFAGTALGG